ncbi:hypothetical protein M5D96_004390, partial [Drosophila gunungcola]
MCGGTVAQIILCPMDNKAPQTFNLYSPLAWSNGNLSHSNRTIQSDNYCFSPNRETQRLRNLCRIFTTMMKYKKSDLNSRFNFRFQETRMRRRLPANNIFQWKYKTETADKPNSGMDPP